MTRKLALLATVLAAGAAGLAGYAAVSAGGTRTVVREATVPSPEPAAATAPLSVTGVYDRASQGVVEITVTSTAESPFGGAQTQQAQGSGFVYDSAGHVVTNEHVVDGARSASVQLWNGKTYKATVVGSDPSTDLAVLRIDAPPAELHPLSLGDSGALRVGQAVVAIGSPFGLEESVTAGIVSALHREMTAPNNFTITDSIQTDAAINHGNSGGPLLDLDGKVIGVTSQIESDSGDNAGVGFAIPSDTVRSVVSQLISSGSVQHAYLGVAIRTASGGVELTQVRSDTPAAKAGLQAGDVVTALDGRKVTDAAGLSSAIDAKKPGDVVQLTYSRDGRSHSASVTLAERPS
ncbi:MAG TPA: trypsin-like peptidase domain-containing protein [Gaiellaceae bacterium]|nr:trypsin-like peptidase domain-containing protein [Gaiellaceae bacterium]